MGREISGCQPSAYRISDSIRARHSLKPILLGGCWSKAESPAACGPWRVPVETVRKRCVTKLNGRSYQNQSNEERFEALPKVRAPPIPFSCPEGKVSSLIKVREKPQA